jgi:glyoxylase-like metal-dependent hydrolase (beta-lactamase superfamily II)
MDMKDFSAGTGDTIDRVAAGHGIDSSCGRQETSAGAAPTYEIYALKYAGPMPSKLAFMLWMEGWDKDVDRNCYLWAIKGENEIIIVDAGSNFSLASQRGLKNYSNPVEVLARIGANSTNVKKVILTHCHWDHLSGIELLLQAFPEAVFYVQKKEFDFWVWNPIAKRAPFLKVSDEVSIKTLAQLEGTPRLQQLSGDTKIMPGIETLLAPGHTIGLQAVAVNTSKGTAIVASDCGHIHENFVRDTPSCLITDMIAWMQSFDKLRAKASSIDLIFPGHDARMHNDFRKVAQGVTQLV